jgi:hypothetical protein
MHIFFIVVVWLFCITIPSTLSQVEVTCTYFSNQIEQPLADGSISKPFQWSNLAQHPSKNICLLDPGILTGYTLPPGYSFNIIGTNDATDLVTVTLPGTINTTISLQNVAVKGIGVMTVNQNGSLEVWNSTFQISFKLYVMDNGSVSLVDTWVVEAWTTVRPMITLNGDNVNAVFRRVWLVAQRGSCITITRASRVLIENSLIMATTNSTSPYVTSTLDNGNATILGTIFLLYNPLNITTNTSNVLVSVSNKINFTDSILGTSPRNNSWSAIVKAAGTVKTNFVIYKIRIFWIRI